MKGMFQNCYLLNNIQFNLFNTNNVDDMREMFSGCENLKKLDISKFSHNNSSIQIDNIFRSCINLKTVLVNHDFYEIFRNKLIGTISILKFRSFTIFIITCYVSVVKN